MANQIKVKFISPQEIEKEATKLLLTHYSDLNLPIDIERIVEHSLKISLLTVIGLEENMGTPGFVGREFNAITLDDFVFNNREVRARFTIAHELGHIILHKDIYSSIYSNLKSYDFLKFRSFFSDKDWNNLEVQANKFASYILIPRKCLDEIVKEHLKKCGGINKWGIEDLQNLVLYMEKTFLQAPNTCIYKLDELYPDLLKVAKNAPLNI